MLFASRTPPTRSIRSGLCFSKLNRTDEEILAYKRAITIKPDHANALERLGAAYFKQKRWAESAAAYDQLKTYRPDAKTYNALGESLLELNKPDDSLQAFNSALGIRSGIRQGPI
jgi:tetratricopeptide (TPR) repeat protein